MQPRKGFRRAVRVLAAVVVLAGIVPAYAQTQGMERRSGARAAKQACKAGDEKTRAECRQGKRHTKQAARQGKTPAAPAEHPAQ